MKTLKTDRNLEKAFQGESMASRKYAAFAEKAMNEGYTNISRLFKAAAHSETIHARNHLRVMNGIKTTQENLKESVTGENFEHTEIYPEFIQEADRENNPDAVRTFRFANEVEKIHEKLFAQALAALATGSDLDSSPIYVCENCGYTVIGEAPERCPICGFPHSYFTKF